MNKNLLLFFAAATVAIFSFAEDKVTQLEWHYGSDPTSFTRYGSSDKAYTDYGFIYIDPARATRMAGCQVNSVKITNGYYKTLIPKMYVIMTESLSDEPILYEYVRITKTTTTTDDNGYTVPDEWKSNEVKLSEPYTIKAGQGFYVGFSYLEQTTTDYPFAFDGNGTTNYAGFLGAHALAGTDMADLKLTDFTADYGALAIAINISGDNIPQHDVTLASLETSEQSVRHNMPYNATMTVLNAGAQPISSLSYKYKSDNVTEKTATYTASTPIEFGKSATISIALTAADKGGVETTSAEITAVNGSADENSGDNTGKTQMLVYNSSTDGSYARNVLGEEFTGTWCPWCPRGYVGMEYMKANYTDGSWIGIAEHSGDEMDSSQFNDIISLYASGYPRAVIDRKTSMVIDPYSSTFQTSYNTEKNVGAPATIELSATHNDTEIYITSSSTFVFDVNPGDFKIEYILREDNVGPYNQYNNYAGGAYGTMGGFENMSGKSSVMFNDVARARKVYDNPFSNGAIAKTPVTHKGYMRVPDGVNIDNTNVIAVITGPNNYVANAKLSMQYASVDDIAADNDTFTPKVENGTLTVGDVKADVYTISGQHIATIERNDSLSLPAGLYIVRANARALKVLIK
jgi:hypothetical protein